MNEDDNNDNTASSGTLIEEDVEQDGPDRYYYYYRCSCNDDGDCEESTSAAHLRSGGGKDEQPPVPPPPRAASFASKLSPTSKFLRVMKLRAMIARDEEREKGKEKQLEERKNSDGDEEDGDDELKPPAAKKARKGDIPTYQFATPNIYQERIVQLLRKRLQNSHSEDKIRALEKALFLASPACVLQVQFPDHPELALDSALRQLASAVVGRTCRKADAVQVDGRVRLLQNLLGRERFREATDVANQVEAIRRAQQALAERRRSSAGSQASGSSAVVDDSAEEEGEGEGEDVPSRVPAAAAVISGSSDCASIPSPAIQLSASHSRLHAVLMRAPLHVLPELDLNAMIDEAKEDLREYRAWTRASATAASAPSSSAAAAATGQAEDGAADTEEDSSSASAKGPSCGSSSSRRRVSGFE